VLSGMETFRLINYTRPVRPGPGGWLKGLMPLYVMLSRVIILETDSGSPRARGPGERAHLTGAVMLSSPSPGRDAHLPLTGAVMLTSPSPGRDAQLPLTGDAHLSAVSGIVSVCIHRAAQWLQLISHVKDAGNSMGAETLRKRSSPARARQQKTGARARGALRGRCAAAAPVSRQTRAVCLLSRARAATLIDWICLFEALFSSSFVL